MPELVKKAVTAWIYKNKKGGELTNSAFLSCRAKAAEHETNFITGINAGVSEQMSYRCLDT